MNKIGEKTNMEKAARLIYKPEPLTSHCGSSSYLRKQQKRKSSAATLRSGTSVGANYREGNRAKSDAYIVNKFESVLQELDETGYWLDLLVKSGILPSKKAEELIKETNELLAIFTTIVTKIKKRMGKI
ncbi:four helix bundle protein [Candidatus Villigracilis proximus]|uniref:four helix bundle protein n=1 Tax=Candidatus Villigracilis proximus TaxID=3140683 RepID=UPI0031EE95B4